MKATKFFLASVFALLFFVGTELSAGQGYCDDFYKKVDVSHLMPPGSHCDGNRSAVWVWWCCTVDPTTGNVTLEIGEVSITNIKCWGNYDFSSKGFWDEIHNQIMKELVDNPINNPFYCDLGEIKSCDDPPFTTFTTAQRASCWALVSEEANPGMGDWWVVLKPCKEVTGFCSTEYTVCYDFSIGQNIITQVGENSTYGTGCSSNEIVFDPDPNEGNWVSDTWNGYFFIPCTPTCD